MHKALFFGSFNPIHNGHLAIAAYVVEQQITDEVVFMVSPLSPFKREEGLLEDGARLELVSLAVEEMAAISVSDLEFLLPKPSYTAQTLQRLRALEPQHTHSLLLGSDQIPLFHRWRNYEEILQYHRIFLYPRPGFEQLDVSRYPGMELMEAPLYDISSTEIRGMIAGGEDVSALLPSKVQKQISRRGYYHK